VQRWCAIEEAGRYDLYCFYSPSDLLAAAGTVEAIEAQLPQEILRTHRVDEHGRLVLSETGSVSEQYAVDRVRAPFEQVDSPLLARMPAEVTALLEEFTIPTSSPSVHSAAEGEVRRHLRRATAFAQFPIVIKEAPQKQQQEMVQSWLERGQAAREQRDLEREPAAVLDGIFFVLQPHFLSGIHSWVTPDAELTLRGAVLGLSFNPHPKATEILLVLADARPGSGEWGLGVRHSMGLMGHLVELLLHEDAAIQESALKRLRLYSGSYFFAGQDGAPLEKLSAQQMEEAQALWREWWSRNQDAFEPLGSSGIWGYVDRSGEWAIPPRFAQASPFRQGRGLVSPGMTPFFNSTSRYYVDRTGARQDHPTAPWGGEPLYPVRVGEYWGYENAGGALIIPAKFDHASAFSEGLASIRIEDKSGYIDAEGSLVIPAQFSGASNFEGGYATAWVEQRCGIIDREGVFILEPVYQSLGSVREDRVRFSRDNVHHGFLDLAGNVLVPPRFASAHDFSEGLAKVVERLEAGEAMLLHGFVDPNGALVIPPAYDDARDFSEGLAAVGIGGHGARRWGFVDRTGEMLIPPQFSNALSFSDGLAAVRLLEEEGGRWGFIDPSGEFVIPPQFTFASEFSEGIAPVAVASPYFHLNPEDYRAALEN